MTKRYEHVKRWRIETKKRMLSAMGEKCVCCGYDKCAGALVFHHLDPLQKDPTVRFYGSFSVSWAKIVNELRKCVLLCCRCHQEVHAGVLIVPADHAKFNEFFAEYRFPKYDLLDICPQCGSMKPQQNRYCSIKCSSIAKRRVDWESIDLSDMLKTMTVVKIAELLDVSDATIRKRLKKLGYISRDYRRREVIST